MSSRDPHIEVLISRYLDGEITARELEDLRARVDSDDQAEDLFEQMQQIHLACQDMVQTHILQPGRPVEDLIAGAWQGQRPNLWAGRVKRVVFSRFVSGMAAGLLIGFLAHLAITSQRTTASRPVDRSQPGGVPVARAAAAATTDDLSSQDTMHEADYYTFTDRQGNHWVIEGLSEERMQPVAYQDF